MNSFDESSTPVFKITDFDKMKLNFIGVDEEVTGECNLWQVHRYKNDFLILTFDDRRLTIDNVKTVESVIGILNTLSP